MVDMIYFVSLSNINIKIVLGYKKFVCYLNITFLKQLLKYLTLNTYVQNFNNFFLILKI